MRGIFRTGARRMTPVYPTVVMMLIVEAGRKGQRILTGTNDGGIEELVRLMSHEMGFPIEVVDQQLLDVPDNPGFWIDWDARHLALPDDVEFVSVHVDHQDCRETKSALAVLPEDRVRLVTELDMVTMLTAS